MSAIFQTILAIVLEAFGKALSDVVAGVRTQRAIEEKGRAEGAAETLGHVAEVADDQAKIAARNGGSTARDVARRLRERLGRQP